MTIEQLGSIGELVGAVATVATLIYLAVQVRQNSAVMRKAAASAMRESGNDVTRILATDHAANHIFWEGIEDRSSLSEKDRRIFDALLTLVLANWREVVELEGAKYLTDQILSGIGDFLMDKPGFHEWWAQWGDSYPAELREVIKRRIEASGSCLTSGCS